MSTTTVHQRTLAPRHLLQWVLALVVAAATVSMAPAPALAAPSAPLDLAVTSVGKDVTLVTTLDGIVTGVTGATGLSDARVSFTSTAGTWTYKLPATSISQLGQPVVLDMTDPALQSLAVPAGQPAALPDGAYTVQTTVTTLGGLLGDLLGGVLKPVLTLVSDSVSVALASFKVPGAPTGLTVPAPTSGSSLVSWVTPADGGSPILSSLVQAVDADGQTVRSCTAQPGASSCTLTGLGADVVGVVVTVTNAIGSSAPVTALLPVVGGGGSGGGGPLPEPTAPSAPTGVTASPRNGAAVVSWVASTSADLPVTGYTVTATPGGRSCLTTGTGLACTVDGLANGTAYTFSVVASALVLNSPASVPTTPVTPATVPGAATWQAASVSYDRATLRWTAPTTDGGSPVTSYRVSVAGRQVTTTGTSVDVTGLAPTTSYVADVVAVNAQGAGVPVSQQVTTGAAPRLTAAVSTTAKRSGSRAVLVRVDLNRAATVVVRVVRGKTVAQRRVALGSAPSWVSVPVTSKTRKLLDGRRVALQVKAADGSLVKAVSGKVKR